MAFLVGPGTDLDAEPRGRLVLREGTGDLEPVEHPHGAVEPAGIGLRLHMGAQQESAAGALAATEHGPDPVDHGLESGLGHPARQPFPRGHIVRRVGRAMHTGLVLAELRQSPQIRE